MAARPVVSNGMHQPEAVSCHLEAAKPADPSGDALGDSTGCMPGLPIRPMRTAPRPSTGGQWSGERFLLQSPASRGDHRLF